MTRPGFLKRFKPETLRPIKYWADLTPKEQEHLSQEYLALTTMDFEIHMPSGSTKAIMTLSLKDFQDIFFLKETKKANVAVDKDDAILKEPVQVQFKAFIEHVVPAMKEDGIITMLLSNKMQRIRLYHLFEKDKNSVLADMIREQAKVDYEDFMKANAHKFKTDEDRLRLTEFILTSPTT